MNIKISNYSQSLIRNVCPFSVLLIFFFKNSTYLKQKGCVLENRGYTSILNHAMSCEMLVQQLILKYTPSIYDYYVEFYCAMIESVDMAVFDCTLQWEYRKS